MTAIFPPTRCYDCLVPIPRDDVLCAKCQADYARVKNGRPS